MIGKNKPSVAQSLEVIFELVTENTERINGLASILIDSMHLLHQTTRKVDESLIPKEYANQMKEELKEKSDYNLKLQKLISEGETDRNKLTVELKEQGKATLFYSYSVIFITIFIVFLGYQFWKERKILDSNLEIIENYESFIKEDKLEKQFKIYIEKQD